MFVIKFSENSLFFHLYISLPAFISDRAFVKPAPAAKPVQLSFNSKSRKLNLGYRPLPLSVNWWKCRWSDRK